MTDIETCIVDFRTSFDGTETWEERRETVPGIIETRFVIARPWTFASRQPTDKDSPHGH